MNRIFTVSLVSSAILLVAAKPNDQQTSPEPSDPSASQRQARDGNNAALELPRPSKAPVPAEVKNQNPLPNEREAVAAARAAKGWVEYDDRGRVKEIKCDDASDADLRLFAPLDGLERLSICGTKVTDAGVTALAKTRTLRYLWFGYVLPIFEAHNPGNPHVTDEGLKSIGQLTELETLGLCGLQITGSGMAHLDGLKHLRFLCLARSGVGDDGTRSIGGHTALRRLYLNGGVTRQGLAELARLTSLEELWVYRRLKDDDLMPIGQIRNLVTLQCGFAAITDEGLRHMKNMTRLRSLDLSMTSATDAGMAYVGQMKGLEILRLSRHVGDAGVANLTGLTKLKELDLDNTKISDAGLAKITALADLRFLNLMNTRVTAMGVARLRGMKKLENIDLDNTDISDEDVRELKDGGIPVSKAGGSYRDWEKQ